MDESSAIRVGVLVPFGNVVHEREFASLRPDGMEFRFAEFVNPDPAAGNLCADLTAKLVQPMTMLKEWGAQVLLIGCTTASMACGSESFQRELERISGIPVVTAARAAGEAMRALGLESVGVATPYGAVSNTTIADFIRSQNIEVSAIGGMELDATPELWRKAMTLTPQEILAFACSVDVAQAQGMYMPCTAINSLDALGPFEAESGKPALSSVQAGYWASLRRIGFDGRRRGYGRLLEQWNF